MKFAAVVLAIAVVAGSALAQSPAPQPDPNTPQGALILLLRATLNADEATERKLMAVYTPQEQALADALVLRAAANARLRTSATKAFGADAAAEMTDTSPARIAATERGIANAAVKIDKDMASIQIEGEPNIELVMIMGQWKLSLAPLTKGMMQRDIDVQVEMIKAIAGAVTQTSEEIDQGKYKSAQEVNHVVESRVRMAARRDPTSQPATEPAP